MGETIIKQRERRPFAGLLIALLFFMGVTPLVRDSDSGNVFLHVAVLGILAASTYVSWSSRNLVVVSSGFLIATAIIWLGPAFLPPTIQAFVRVSIVGAGFAFAAVMILRAVARHKQVTTDTILGGINAYLLIACAFMNFHAAVMILDPNAYWLGNQALQEISIRTEDSNAFSTLLYFSFTTLTTLGYGDIAPVHPIARILTSAEAVLGQLFVAIYIARLVSIQANQRSTKD